MGKQRIIAETGAGQHGVATATICARYGLECVIYMGSEDIERQRPNVQSMTLLGATVVPATSGSRTLKDAMNDAIRDWVTNVDHPFYLIGSVAGMHPYPTMVRDFQAVIGRERLTQMPAQFERLGMAKQHPDVVIACVGGGSNAIGIFHPYIEHKIVRLIGVEAAGLGLDTGRHAASIQRGSSGVLHGNRSLILQDDNGQVQEAHSISAGLDYPGVGPEHAWLHEIGRAEYVGATDDEALRGFLRLSRVEGIIPALEAGHAIAHAIKLAATLPRAAGHSGQPVRPGRQGHGNGDGSGGRHGRPVMSRLNTTFQRLRRQGRKALIPYVTVGYPSADITPALLHVLVEAGADVIELGVPFSDPSADGPTIQTASEHALSQGIGLPQALNQVRRFRESDADTPVVLMGYANPIERYDLLRQPGAFAEDAASAGVDGVLVIDYPPEVSGELAAQLRRHSIDLIFLLAPTSAERRIRQVAERAGGYVYCVSVKGVTGTTTLDMTQVRNTLARIRRHVRIPVGVGFGIRDACTARDVAQVADAIVIGSWLIESLADKPAAEALTAASDLIRDVRRQLDRDAPEQNQASKPEHPKT